MPLPEVFTYTDALDALNDFATGKQSLSPAILRRCVRAGYREVSTGHDWSFLKAQGRVNVYAPQTTGTITYDHTGGTYERQLTLAGATWPSWIEDAAIRIDDVVCDVEEYKSATVVTLDANLNPGEDVAALTSYSVYPRWYTLPNDFGQMVSVLEKSAWGLLQPIPFGEMAALDQYRDTDGDMAYYSIASAQDRYGQMALYVHPPSDTDEVLSFAYRKKPRDLRYSGSQTAEYTGTIAVTAGSATVTGTGTTFESGMVGSILRISSTTGKPTGIEGINPWAEQRVIAAVSTVTPLTVLTLDANVATTRTGKGYIISDPIDFEAAAWEAFLRCCEKHYALHRGLKELPAIAAMYEDAMFRAKSADCRVIQGQQAGVGRTYASRLADSTDRPILT